MAPLSVRLILSCRPDELRSPSLHSQTSASATVLTHAICDDATLLSHTEEEEEEEEEEEDSAEDTVLP